MFTYHYCAHYQKPWESGVHHLDGIAIISKEVKTMDDYRELKKRIVPDNYELLTIVSLTLLSRGDEKGA